MDLVTTLSDLQTELSNEIKAAQNNAAAIDQLTSTLSGTAPEKAAMPALPQPGPGLIGSLAGLLAQLQQVNSAVATSLGRFQGAIGPATPQPAAPAQGSST